MNWYLKVIKQYADFKGRARRKEFWMFTLVSILIGFALQLLDYMLGIQFSSLGMYGRDYGPLYSIYSLVMLVPSLAVSVRRLHDVNKSGWYLLLWLFLIIGWIWLLVLHCTEGTKGPNKYGADPKNGESFNDDALDSHLTT
ncbi:hypothetical protein CNR22_19210 [Sphingobacteriaceae bacterium]|nr:hypothetical protein CNR22_19210 [Sphingobacteriaceae bacterium]